MKPQKTRFIGGNVRNLRWLEMIFCVIFSESKALKIQNLVEINNNNNNWTKQ
jgi:hypothetical protein